MKEFLSLVSKPVRYLGQEFNSIKKDPREVKVKFCLAFPDVYEVGMSHLGIQILYHILNSQPGVACERVFAPWIDMEEVLRGKSVSLSSLESSTPLGQFDVLGFSLQYELSFTNVLNMLDLSHIPLFSRQRDEHYPLVIAGGPSAFNPAPVADFFDAVVIGDGEEVVLEICDLALQWKEGRVKKEDRLKSLSRIEGVYVPGLHGKGQPVRKRMVSDLHQAPFPTCPIVPYMKLVHDRLNMEIARGCKRGCRFCEAGFIQRPYRERSPRAIEEGLFDALHQTGFEEVSLLSLSAGDYRSIGRLLSRLMDRFEQKKVGVSFPSLRIESVMGHLAGEVQRVRKTGFTLAPEAGTERLRKVINKEMDEEILFQGLSELFSKGWKNLKLYFMIGLPTEREEDLKGILDLSRKIALIGERQRIHPNLNVSVSSFVPKPHTPFQWVAQNSLEEMREKLHYLKREVKRYHLRFKWQDPHLSRLEGIFSRGDQDLSRVLREAHRLGCRFDGWSDQFKASLWQEAFEKTGVKGDFYTRKKDLEGPLPWSFVETGVAPSFLREEFQRALGEETSPPCVERDCRRCGVCDGKTVRVRGSDPDEISRAMDKTAGRGRRKEIFRRKIRLRFKKVGEIRFLSHLELAHLFHRASNRAGLPLCYSEGFHPMPRIIFATALPVGMESLIEFVDLEMEGRFTPSEVVERLHPVLPRGIEIMGAEEVPLTLSSSLLLTRSTYWISLDHLLSREETAARVKTALEKKELLLHQQRKGKMRKVDATPLIEKMVVKESQEWEGGPPGWGVELVLRRGEGPTAKPLEVVGTILGLGEEALTELKVVKLG